MAENEPKDSGATPEGTPAEGGEQVPSLSPEQIKEMQENEKAHQANQAKWEHEKRMMEMEIEYFLIKVREEIKKVFFPLILLMTLRTLKE